MIDGIRHEQEVGVARSSRRRIPALIGVLLAGMAVLAFPSPAGAQVPPGSQATPLVGSGIVADCPPGSPGDLAAGTATINGVTVGFPAAGRCVPLSADAEGSYTVAGSFTDPLPFTAECHNAGGTVQTRSGVTVPAGTVVNPGTAGQFTTTAPTVIDTPNTRVRYPGGREATLNQVTTTATTVTVNAIVFDGGPIVGQVICGASVYPLAVDVGDAAGATPAVAMPAPSSGGDGPATSLLLTAGLVALAVLVAQVVVARTWRRRGNATS